MRKIFVLLTGFILLGISFASAAPGKQANKILNPRIVSAAKATTITYQGTKIFIPAGTTLLLGTYEDGSIVIRGMNIDGVKVDNGTIIAKGPVLLSVQPQTQVITVTRGNDVKILDTNGRMAALSAGASVSLADIRTTVAPVEIATVVQPQEAVADELPAFVADTQTDSVVSEQATQDVIETEEVLSPSAP